MRTMVRGTKTTRLVLVLAALALLVALASANETASTSSSSRRFQRARRSNVARQVVANLPAPARQRVQNAVQNGNIPQPRQVPPRLRGIASRATPDQRQEFFSELPEGVQDRVQRARSVPAGERRSAALSFLQRVRERGQEAASNGTTGVGNRLRQVRERRQQSANNGSTETGGEAPITFDLEWLREYYPDGVPERVRNSLRRFPMLFMNRTSVNNRTAARLPQGRARRSADLGGALARMLRDPSLVDGELRTTIRHVLERRIPEDMTVGDLLDRIQRSDFEPTEAEAERIARFRERAARSGVSLDDSLREVLSDYEARTRPAEEEEAAANEVASFSKRAKADDRKARVRAHVKRAEEERKIRAEKREEYQSRIARRVKSSKLSDEEKEMVLRNLSAKLDSLPAGLTTSAAWRELKREMRKQVSELVNQAADRRRRQKIATNEVLRSFYERVQDILPKEEAMALVDDAEARVRWMEEEGIEADEIVNRLLEQVEEDLRALEDPEPQVAAFSGPPQRAAVLAASDKEERCSKAMEAWFEIAKVTRYVDAAMMEEAMKHHLGDCYLWEPRVSASSAQTPVASEWMSQLGSSSASTGGSDTDTISSEYQDLVVVNGTSVANGTATE